LVYQEEQAVAMLHRESGASPTRVAAEHAGGKSIESAESFKALGNGPHHEGAWTVKASA
jgi:hypothetical protein